MSTWIVKYDSFESDDVDRSIRTVKVEAESALEAADRADEKAFERGHRSIDILSLEEA